MAILDKESRSRGLRMPSLSAIKSRKKNAESPPRRSSSSDEVVIPTRMDSIPGRSLRSQEKDLPPNPLPSPPAFPSAPADSLSNQSPYHHINPTPKYEDRPLPRFPRVPVPKREEPPVPAPAPALIQQVTPPSSEDQYPIHPQEHVRPIEDPLESYIPDPEPEPEPEIDGTSTYIEPVSSEESNGPWTPPDYDPVAAPLNRLHYACYQEHRSMPTANNLWHPLPCMTCQKYDREIRYRCVFCCLRICASCYQTLQKCPNRSLAQLMKTMPSHE